MQNDYLQRQEQSMRSKPAASLQVPNGLVSLQVPHNPIYFQRKDSDPRIKLTNNLGYRKSSFQ